MTKILLVEDNVTFRNALKEILHSRFPSMEILEAGDGKEALHCVKTSLPDLIFMDIKLPGENGLTLTRKIKQEHPEVPIAILTSHDLPEYREAAFKCKANHFMVKGSPSSQIFDMIESITSPPKKSS